MSTFKIKIPALSEQQPKAASRKAAKRRITSDDDTSDSDGSPSTGPSVNKPLLKKPRLSRAEDSEDEDDASPPSRSQPSKTTTVKPTANIKGNVKRKHTILSDDELTPEPEERPVVSKAKAKEVKGRVRAGSSGGTGSVKITARNESKPAASPAPTGKKRFREDEEMEVDVTTVATPGTTKTSTPSVPAPDDPPPKKKLPTIKKKSKTDSAATSTFVSPAPAKLNANVTIGTPKSQPAAATGLPKKPQAPVQATTMNPSGTGDYDLRDTSIWQSLIGKNSSSSGPRVGIEKRVSSEERRKQLDKMRDDARAAREELARHTFDLQAQSRKIEAFEKKLQHVHEVKMYGPNLLGAAFKTRPVPSSGQPRRRS